MATALYNQLKDDGVELPVAYCLGCHKEVVVYGTLGGGTRAAEIVWCCLFCDEEVLMEEDGLQYHSMGDLKTLGYEIVDPGEDSGRGGCGSCGNKKRQ